MPQVFLHIPRRRIWVSTDGEVYCHHNRLAVKYLSRTSDNFNRYFFTCDGFRCCPGNSRRRARGWIWQEDLIWALEYYGGDELIDIVEAFPARLSARTRAEIQAQSQQLSAANPGGYLTILHVDA